MVTAAKNTYIHSIDQYLRTPLKKNHVVQFFAAAKGRDSVVKLGGVLSEIVLEIVKEAHASEPIIEGVKSTAQGFKDARTLFGLLNVLEGSLSLLYQQICNVCAYVSLFFKEDPIVVKVKKKDPEELGKIVLHDGKEYALSAKEPANIGEARIGESRYFAHPTSREGLLETRREKSVAIVGELGRFVQTATYSFSFGVCRPIGFAEKHFKERVSENARQVGQKFGILMLICHSTGLVTGTADIIRDGLLYLKSSRLEEDVNEFFAALTRHILYLLEKLFELGCSLITVFHLAAPAAVRLTFALCAATLGVYKAWQDTAI